MKYITAAVVIIVFFSWSILLLNLPLKEIKSLKAQLAIEKDYNQDLENDVLTCKSDVDFLKQGVEEMMQVCRMPR